MTDALDKPSESAEPAREIVRVPHRGKAIATFAIGVVTYVGLSLAFAWGMKLSTFGGQTLILLLAAIVLFALASVVPVFRLRANLPVYCIFPFCWHVMGNYCGDMGNVHMFDSVPFILSTLLLFVAITIACIYKVFRLFFPQLETQRRASNRCVSSSDAQTN